MVRRTFADGADGASGWADLQAAVRFWCKDKAGAEAAHGPIGDWDTSRVTDMAGLFGFGNHGRCMVNNVKQACGCEHFNEDISAWDVSSVNTMSGMFAGAAAFNQPCDRDGPRNLETAHAFPRPPLTSGTVGVASRDRSVNRWNTAKVTSFRSVFEAAVSFNQPLDNWDVSRAKNLYAAFRLAKRFNQPLVRAP
jgi:surface protein